MEIYVQCRSALLNVIETLNPAQKVSAQKVSGHKVSKIDNKGQKVSSQNYFNKDNE